MDFVQDALFNGERFRVLTVVDNCTGPPGGKICHGLLAGKSLKWVDVVVELIKICLVEGCFPERIQCDNRSEFIRGGLLQGNGLMGIFEWCNARLLKTRKTDRQPIMLTGSPERSFNGKFRAAAARMNVFP